MYFLGNKAYKNKLFGWSNFAKNIDITYSNKGGVKATPPLFEYIKNNTFISNWIKKFNNM